MIRLIQWIIFGHIHKWEYVKDVIYTTRIYDGEVIRKQTKYICKCVGCGKYKGFLP